MFIDVVTVCAQEYSEINIPQFRHTLISITRMLWSPEYHCLYRYAIRFEKTLKGLDYTIKCCVISGPLYFITFQICYMVKVSVAQKWRKEMWFPRLRISFKNNSYTRVVKLRVNITSDTHYFFGDFAWSMDVKHKKNRSLCCVTFWLYPIALIIGWSSD